MKKYKVTCRYGIEYEVEYSFRYTNGECMRGVNMLKECCCFVCHNHDCKEPRDEKIDCKDECRLFFKNKPCENI